jgi:hypothetical protein
MQIPGWIQMRVNLHGPEGKAPVPCCGVAASLSPINMLLRRSSV